MRFLKYILGFIALIHSVHVMGQQPTQIIIKDSHDFVLENTLIQCDTLIALTDDRGAVNLTLPDGDYIIHVENEGVKESFSIHLPSHSPLILQLNKEQLQLHEVVKTGSHIERINKTFSQENFNKDLIVQTQPQSLSDVFSKTTGVSFKGNGNAISRPVIRGLSGNRIAIANDGMILQDQQWGDDHGSSIDVHDAYSITLLKGPATLALGSGALGGVVSIHSKEVPQLPKKETSFQAYYQSNNQLVGGNFYGFQKFKNPWFWEFQLNGQMYADFRIPTSSLIVEDSAYDLSKHRVGNTSGALGSSSFKFGRKGVKGKWSNKTYFSNQKDGIFPALADDPSLVVAAEHDSPRKIQLPNQEVQTFYNLTQGKYTLNQWDIHANFQWLNNQRWERQFPEIGYDSEIALFLNQNTLSSIIEGEWNQNHSEWHNGIQFQNIDNTSSGNEYVIPTYDQTNVGVYSVYNYTFNNQWLVSAGMRYDYARIKTQTSIREDNDTLWGFEKYYRNFSFSSGFEFHLKFFTIDGSISRSFRIPNIGELASYGGHLSAFRVELGNPNLGSEKAWQFDVSLQFKNKKRKWEWSPYFYYFDNYIYLQEISPILFEYRNNRSKMWGMEWSYEENISSQLHSLLNFDFVRGEIVGKKENLPAIPPAKIYAELHYEFVKEWFSLFNHPVVGMGLTQFFSQKKVGINEDSTPASTLLNVFLRTDFTVGKHLMKINFSADNIFNVKYYNHLSNFRRFGIPEKGRNVKLNIFFKF